MKHHFFKAYSLLFYFLAGITSFFIGLSYAAIVDVGKGQMLAGGAIVLGYGVIAGCIGFLLSLFVVYKSQRKNIIRWNIILACCIAALYMYFYLEYKKRQNDQDFDNHRLEQPERKTPSEIDNHAGSIALLSTIDTERTLQKVKPVETTTMGLGMFTPNFYENPVLYFYGNVNLEKSVMEQIPIDSITFKRMENGGFEITTAPPWLVPEHLKMDYDMLYFKVQTLSHDFLEVTVNTTTNQTAFVDRYAGQLRYWPEFLLGVHSVEFPNPEQSYIYVKPLDHAGQVAITYSFMKPLRIKNEWMYVELQNENFQAIGHGWIKWHNGKKLNIRYALLS